MILSEYIYYLIITDRKSTPFVIGNITKAMKLWDKTIHRVLMVRIPFRHCIMSPDLSVLQENNFMQFVYTENAVSVCEFGTSNVNAKSNINHCDLTWKNQSYNCWTHTRYHNTYSKSSKILRSPAKCYISKMGLIIIIYFMNYEFHINNYLNLHCDHVKCIDLSYFLFKLACIFRNLNLYVADIHFYNQTIHVLRNK